MSQTTPIIGHEAVQAQLVRYLQNSNLPHALLLTGPQGIGKAAVADTLMRCLLTGAHSVSQEGGLFGDTLPQETSTKLSYDAAHPAILRLESGGHGNVKTVRPLEDEKKKMSFTTISIDQIREVVKFMQLSTSEAGWRIIIIDPADGMNTNAENALLKVLEEPPAQTLLILITHQPDRLLPTTRSRCRELKLFPPSEAQVMEILHTQKVNIHEDDKIWLSQLAPLSAGAWQDYLQADALSLYHDWLQMLENPAIDKVQPFTAKLAKSEAKEWHIAAELYLRVLQRLQHLSGQVLGLEAISEAEEAAFSRLSVTPLWHWQEAYAEALHWLPLTTQSNYDKKQVVQSLLYQAGNRPKTAA